MQSPAAEVRLDQLAGLRAFVVAVDGRLAVKWASEAVLRRVPHALDLKVTEMIEAVRPRGELTSSSIARSIGLRHHLLLKSGDGPLPLAGHWVASRGGFVLLAHPDVTVREDLSRFTFDDFPEGDPIISQIVAAEEHATSLREAKAATSALRETRRRLETIFQALAEGLVVLGPDGRITRVNRVVEEILGLGCDELVGRKYMTLARWLLRPDGTPMPPHEMACFRALAEGRVVRNVEEGIKRPDGSIAWLNVNAAPLIGVDGELQGAVSSLTDVTERKRNEERYRVLFESSTDAIMTLKPPSWRFTSCNAATVRMFGVKDEQRFTSLGFEDLSPEVQPGGHASADMVKEMIATAMRERSHLFEWTFKRTDGSEFPATVLFVRMKVAGEVLLQATVRDISEQKALETELAHARKLEAVGQLAAGIAHEINTPTQFVGDSMHFIKEGFEALSQLLARYRQAMDALGGGGVRADLRKEIKEAEEQADLEYIEEHIPNSFERCFEGLARISTIVSSMKEFAHPDREEKSPADINRALQTTLTIARNEYKYVADVETELGDLPPVVCHLGALNQVFLNLIVNAAHAIGEAVAGTGGRGVIRVRTAHEGDTVRIEIEDTGCGIPAAVRDRIFDPFFTTKEVGKGSGQGLAIARSVVVDKHNGSITCESEEGVGTTFTIVLPVGGKGDRRAGVAESEEAHSVC